MADKLSIDRILVVVDGTDSGAHAARCAVKFAAAHGAKVTAVAVVDTETLKRLLTSNILAEPEMQEFDRELETSAQTSLNYVALLAQEAGVTVHLVLSRGSAHTVVTEEVRRLNPNLLVMGSFSTSLIKRDLNARERRLIVDEVKCPILLVS